MNLFSVFKLLYNVSTVYRVYGGPKQILKRVAIKSIGNHPTSKEERQTILFRLSEYRAAQNRSGNVSGRHSAGKMQQNIRHGRHSVAYLKYNMRLRLDQCCYYKRMLQ